MRWRRAVLVLGALSVPVLWGAEQVAVYTMASELESAQKAWVDDIKKSTGLDLNFGGDLRLTGFVPRVTLRADDIRLSNVPGADGDTMLRIGSVTASIPLFRAIFALDARHIDFDEVLIGEPHINIRPDETGRSSLDFVIERLQAAAKPAGAGRKLGIDRLVIRGGQVDFQRARDGPVDTVRGLQMDGLAATAGKLFHGKTEAMLNGVHLSAEPLSVTREEDTIDVVLKAKSDHAGIAIEGRYASGSFTGKATMQAAAVGPANTQLARLIHRPEAVLPFPGTLKTRLEGEFAVSPVGLNVDLAGVELGADTGRGTVAIDFAVPSRIEAALALETLDLRHWTFPKNDAGPPPDCTRPAGKHLFGDLALDLKAAVKTMKYASAEISNIDLDLRTHNGAVTVRQLIADLPAGMTIAARSDPPAPGVATKGNVKIRAPRLRDTLRAFDIDLSRLRDDAMSGFELDARVEWGDRRTVFSDITLRLDEVRGRGFLGFTPDSPATIEGALSLEAADFGRYVPKGEFEAYVATGSGIDVSAALSLPAGDVRCLMISAAKVDVGLIDATGIRRVPEGGPPNASDAAANSIAQFVAEIGDVPQEVRDLLTVGGLHAPIGSLAFSGVESTLPHLGPILGRIDAVTPISFSAGRVVVRDGSSHWRDKPTLALSNLRLALGVRPVTTPDPPTRQQRATFDVAVSDVITAGVHIAKAEAEATMDFTVGDGSSRIVRFGLDSFQVNGGLEDRLRTAGIPRIIGAGEPVRILPFALSGTLAADQDEVIGMLNTLELGDVVSADRISVHVARERGQPLTVSMFSTDVHSLAGRHQSWARGGVNLNTFKTVAAPCQVPPETQPRIATANILLRGKLTKLSEAYALLDGPAKTSQPMLQAISIQGGLGNGGLVLGDFSAYFAGKSTFSLRLSAVPYLDDFGTESLDIGGCLNATAAMQDAPPLQTDGFRRLILKERDEWMPGDIVKLDVAGRFRADGGQATNLGSLSSKIEMQRSGDAVVESFAVTTNMVQLQSISIDDPERPSTLTIGPTKVTFAGTTLSLGSRERRPLIEAVYVPRAPLSCGRGQRIDVAVDIGDLGLEAARAARAFGARLQGSQSQPSPNPKIKRLADDTPNCSEWRLTAKVASIDAVTDSLAMVLHGKTSSDDASKSRLEDISIDVEQKATGNLTYNVGATLAAQPNAVLSLCQPLRQTDVAPRRPIDAGAKERRIEVGGRWPRDDSKVWTGEITARIRCIDLRHLLAIYEAATQEPLTRYATVKHGMIEELSLAKKEGDFDTVTGHLDLDANVTMEIAPSGWARRVMSFFAKSLRQSLGTGLSLSTRIDAKNGLLAGAIESVDPDVHDPQHKNYQFARKFPYVFRVSPTPNTRVANRWNFDVEVKSPGEWVAPQYDPACSRGSAQVPSFHQVFYGVCLWNCGPESLMSLLDRLNRPGACNR